MLSARHSGATRFQLHPKFFLSLVTLAPRGSRIIWFYNVTATGIAAENVKRILK